MPDLGNLYDTLDLPPEPSPNFIVRYSRYCWNKGWEESNSKSRWEITLNRINSYWTGNTWRQVTSQTISCFSWNYRWRGDVCSISCGKLQEFWESNCSLSATLFFFL